MNLIQKYDIQAPRYTSYPAVPYWNNKINQDIWIDGLKLKGDLEQGVDLYVHIPYCQSLCWYCGCHRVVTKDKSVEKAYVDYLIKEFELYSEKLGDIQINSIHLGGGTPTFLSADALEKLFSRVLKNKSKDFLGAIEIDPRTVDDQQLSVLKKYGFKRISMGIQDFDEKVQKAINRIQPIEMVQALCEKLRMLGFESINFDLIYGLPLQTAETIKQTITKVHELRPDMIAYYSYAHVPWKVKNQKLIKDEELPSTEDKKQLAELGEDILSSNGYHKIGFDHYAHENSYLYQNKKNRKLLRSFMGYTDKKSKTQLAIGVSGIACSEIGFVQNEKDVKKYMDFLDQDSFPLVFGHLNNEIDVKVSDIIQDLMCNSFTDFSALDENQVNRSQLLEMQEDGLLNLVQNNVEVTDLGVHYLRNIATSFDQYWDSSQTIFSRTT